MENIEIRVVIKILFLEGKKAADIKVHLDQKYPGYSPSLNTIYHWIRQLKMGRRDLHNEKPGGQKISVRTSEMVMKVQEVVLKDRRLKLSEIERIVPASRSTVYKIIHDDLGMRKVSARWVPKLLNEKQMKDRVDCARAFLNRCGDDPDSIVKRIVTGDETMVLYFDPLSKRESMEWRCPSEPRPIKAKVQQSRRKIMATVFWDSQGILMVDFKKEGTTVTATYYATLLERLRKAIREKRWGKLAGGVLLLHDNAPVHTAAIAKATAVKCGFEEIPHPPYSPDLAPSDYYLFRDLKKDLRGRRFDTESEMIEAVWDFFNRQSSEYYHKGIKLLYVRCQKCIDVQGYYIEK